MPKDKSSSSSSSSSSLKKKHQHLNRNSHSHAKDESASPSTPKTPHAKPLPASASAAAVAASQPYTKLSPTSRKEEEKKRKKKNKKALDNTADGTHLLQNAIETFSASSATQKKKKSSSSSPFLRLSVKVYVHLPPCFAGQTRLGINEQLNSFLMRYTPQIDGVVLAHSNVKFMEDAGRVMYDSPYCHFWVQARLLVWRPVKGSKLVGTVTIQSPSHIGLLLYGTFNASIPAEQIPKDKYEWRQETEDGTGNQGEWVEKATGAAVNSSPRGSLQFLVTDLIKANDMLTVSGTLKM